MNLAVLFLIYILLEGLTFWGIASLFGAGWALIGLGVLFILGIILSMVEMRSVTARALEGKENAGAVLGDNGLIMVGSTLLALPGYLSTLAGLLFIFGPTRSLVRRSLARKLQERMDDMAYQVFSQARTQQGSFSPFGMHADPTTGAKKKDRFGSFGSDESVIDSADIEKWEEENGWK
ncbi:MAG: FxsA family protein [Corynebacterium glucuronolyticum]|nr:FxsA family protein [Corynebacterium glucuronolyticum]